MNGTVLILGRFDQVYWDAICMGCLPSSIDFQCCREFCRFLGWRARREAEVESVVGNGWKIFK